jgi:LacI family transcriptional regulator
MGARNEVTIYDIANVLHLSPSTISRALSGARCVGTQTRAKIVKTASDLGYHRSFLARKLNTRQSSLIAAIVTQFNTPISAGVLSGAEVAANENGCSLIVRQSMNDSTRRSSNINSIRSQNVAGLLVTSSYFQEFASLADFGMLNIPLVVVEASYLLPSSPKKRVGDFENAFDLTEHLIKNNCKRIAYVSLDLDRSRHLELVAGYRQALNDHHLAFDESLILSGQSFQKSWTDMCRAVLSMSPRPDGIVLCNRMINAIAFAGSESGATNREYWITCRNGKISALNEMRAELGRIAASLLISMSDVDNPPLPLSPFTNGE